MAIEQTWSAVLSVSVSKMLLLERLERTNLWRLRVAFCQKKRHFSATLQEIDMRGDCVRLALKSLLSSCLLSIEVAAETAARYSVTHTRSRNVDIEFKALMAGLK